MEKGEQREAWSSGSSGPPSDGSEYSVTNHHYYQKYELIYQHTCTLAAWHSHLTATEARLLAAISGLSVKVDSLDDPLKPKVSSKKARRVSDDIHKCYRCDVQNCQNLYGSETSLRNHTKHSHPDIFIARKRGRRANPISSSLE